MLRQSRRCVHTKRLVLRIGRLAALVSALAGCVELGLIEDGTSVSMGRPSGGYLVAGRRLPDNGEGFTTKEVWRTRGVRYGTDELVDLITSVGRQLAQTPGEKLVVADLSTRSGGEGGKRWHRSHQSGRDVDLVFFMRDAQGKPMEADSMRVFDAQGVATDGSGITVDIPRTWELVRSLITSREAIVQWVFVFEPIAQKLLEHAIAKGEPEFLIARARLVMKQPNDSARHDDHMHVRVYCTERDRAYGCVDIGPREPMMERIATGETTEQSELPSLITELVAGAASVAATEVLIGR
jgi:penicillin-insensitive murein endopeptidase